MSFCVGCRCHSDLALLWLWLWPAATAPIRPLAWEPPNAAGVALKTKKKKKRFLCTLKFVNHRLHSYPLLSSKRRRDSFSIAQVHHKQTKTIERAIHLLSHSLLFLCNFPSVFYFETIQTQKSWNNCTVDTHILLHWHVPAVAFSPDSPFTHIFIH